MLEENQDLCLRKEITPIFNEEINEINKHGKFKDRFIIRLNNKKYEMICARKTLLIQD